MSRLHNVPHFVQSFSVCVVAEQWMKLVRKDDDIRTCLLYKLDERFFRRSTKNAGEMMVRKESL